jgi:hypothetical protein
VRQGISDVNQGVSFVLTETNDTLNVIVEDTKNDGLTKFSKHNPLGFAWNGNFVLESKSFTIINGNNYALCTNMVIIARLYTDNVVFSKRRDVVSYIREVISNFNSDSVDWKGFFLSSKWTVPTFRVYLYAKSWYSSCF